MKLKNFLTEAEEKVDNTIQKIIDLLKKNPSPEDSTVHKLSDDLGIDTHKFEAMIYKMCGSFWGNGRALDKGITEKDVDKKELEMGIKVEMEHTDDPEMAKRIALDHLAELKNYYSLLLKMEKDAGVKD